MSRQMTTCWPSQSFSEASPSTFYLHFIYQSVSPCPHISSKEPGISGFFSASACCRSQQNCSQFNSVQSLSCVWLFVIPWTAECQASLSITNSQNLIKLMSFESVMPSNHLILYHPLLLPPLIFPSIRVFSNESALHIRWPKYWSFSFSIKLPMNIQDWFPSGLTGLISLVSKRLSRVFSNTTV